MPNLKIISVVSVVSLLSVSAAFSTDTKTTAVDSAAPSAVLKDTKTAEDAKKLKDAKEAKVVKAPTREDMIGSIKSSLDSFSEIMGTVSGLKKEADSSGKAFYSYQGVKLEDLDKEQLHKLFSRVNGEASRLRIDRTNKQLENIRRINQINQQNRQIRPPAPVYIPATPPKPAPIYNQPRPAPTIPSIPKRQG